MGDEFGRPCGGGDFVAEDLASPAEWLVGGDDQAQAVAAAADGHEQSGSRLGANGMYPTS